MVKPHIDQKERSLRERGIELRLRELEAEVNGVEPKFHRTVKDNSTHQSTNPHHQIAKQDDSRETTRFFGHNLKLVIKISGFFIGGILVVVAAQLIAGLTFFVAIGLAGWLCFELGQKSS